MFTFAKQLGVATLVGLAALSLTVTRATAQQHGSHPAHTTAAAQPRAAHSSHSTKARTLPRKGVSKLPPIHKKPPGKGDKGGQGGSGSNNQGHAKPGSTDGGYYTNGGNEGGPGGTDPILGHPCPGPLPGTSPIPPVCFLDPYDRPFDAPPECPRRTPPPPRPIRPYVPPPDKGPPDAGTPPQLQNWGDPPPANPPGQQGNPGFDLQKGINDLNIVKPNQTGGTTGRYKP